MPWFYVDDAFADSKPVMALDRSLRNEAIGLWVRCGAWSAKEETDGHVSLDTVKSFDGTPRLIRALHDQAGLWVEDSPESWRKSRKILFGNWEKWQKTRAENIAKRKADAIRQAAHRRGKKGRNYIAPDQLSSADAEMSQRDIPDGPESRSKNVSRCESQRPDPDPTRPSLVETYVGGVTEVDARDPGPRPQCPRHTENHPGPCPDCKRRRKWDEANAEDELARQRRKREQLTATVRDCPDCDPWGRIETPQGLVDCPNHLPLKDISNA